MPIMLAVLVALSPGTRVSAPTVFTPVPAPRLFSETRPEPTDRWLGWDKFWHFSASFVSVGAGYQFCTDRLNLSHPPSAGIALGGTLGLGVGKELLDRYGRQHRFSWKDMAANALGIAAGYFVFVHRY
ncbi:MAG: hypothetical protein R6X14_06095 [bacterium]